MPGIGIVSIPDRFEPLAERVGRERVSQVLLDSRPDLDAMKQALAEVTAAGQGKLAFVLGTAGSGKTSLAESLPIYLADIVDRVLTPPAQYDLTVADLPRWIADAVRTRPSSQDRVTVVNLDGRENPTIDEGAVVNLNALLRRTPHLLALWPVTRRQFADEAVARLRELGGLTALAKAPIHELVGIDRSRYFDVLGMILTVLGVSLRDAAVSDDEARALVAVASTVGDYLGRVQNLVVERYDLGELGTTLPRLYVVITSNAEDTTQHCRMLRRGNGFFVDPDRLLQFSRANVADDWRRRAQTNARQALPFIASLFELRLVNVSNSAVVNACAFSADSELRGAVRRHYPSPVSSNAGNALKGSALVRVLTGQEDVGTAASSAGAPVRKAYTELQRMTGRKHREINAAILDIARKQLHIQLPGLRFENEPIRDKGLRVDAWVERERERPEAIEFNHRAEHDTAPAAIASYVLTKVQDYARDYGLI